MSLAATTEHQVRNLPHISSYGSVQKGQGDYTAMEASTNYLLLPVFQDHLAEYFLGS